MRVDLAEHENRGPRAAAEVARALAEALLDGPWEPSPMRARGEETLGTPDRWLPHLVRTVRRVYPASEELGVDRLTDFVLSRRGFHNAWRARLHRLRLRRRYLPPPAMAPSRVPLRDERPALATVGDLADWLSVSPEVLNGLADPRDLHRRGPERLRHYRRWWVAPRCAMGSPRLVEAPKDRLRASQRRILRDLLRVVPAHPAAHGFELGRSVWTCAQVHAGEDVLIRLDLRSFFPSVPVRRVAGLFRALGYPDRVAFLLACLCTTRTPPDVLATRPSCDADAERHVRRVYGERHLPQGAPTSPALANRVAYRLDARLAGLARARGVHYTRYADDLFLSGPRTHATRDLVRFAARIVRAEGFVLHDRKVRRVGPGRRHTCLGLTVNEAPSVPRRERERLEAILTNCVRHGPASQNRGDHPRWRDHLRGRIAWIEQVHPRHGARLRALFDAIAWTGA